MTTQRETQFSKRMRHAREEAGISLSDAAIELRQMGLSKRMCRSLETIRRLEVGITTEAKANPVLMIALANLYGCKVSDLSPAIAKEVKGLRDLVAQTPA